MNAFKGAFASTGTAATGLFHPRRRETASGHALDWRSRQVGRQACSVEGEARLCDRAGRCRDLGPLRRSGYPRQGGTRKLRDRKGSARRRALPTLCRRFAASGNAGRDASGCTIRHARPTIRRSSIALRRRWELLGRPEQPAALSRGTRERQAHKRTGEPLAVRGNLPAGGGYTTGGRSEWLAAWEREGRGRDR